MQDELNLTKIIATLGPATSSPEVIRELVREGVDVFRINFSHGDLQEYEMLLKNVRKVSDEEGLPIAVLGDLPGPKIRIGEVVPEGVRVEKGDAIFIISEERVAVNARPFTFSTNYPETLFEIDRGERILIDDGNVELVCMERKETDGQITLVTEVVTGGIIRSRKGLNLPDTELTLPALTDRDEELIRFAVEKGFDFLALSFVRQGGDVKELKDRLKELGARPSEPPYRDDLQSDNTILEGRYKGFIPVISKIEKPQAVQNLESILRETDMVMVARGDLGVEMDLTEVAVIQKQIINACREHGVPVIVATQMLQSMIDSPTPTRAEVSDVANAIFDGADAIMLSGETAIGVYPIAAVRTMNRIALKTNAYIRKTHHTFEIPAKMKELRYRSAALANGVKTMVSETDIDIIGVWSQLGGSAVFLSQCRIPQPIFAFSPDERTLRLLSILFGIQPLKMEKPATSLEFMTKADELLTKQGLARKDDTAIYISREPIDQVGMTNQVNLHFIGSKG